MFFSFLLQVLHHSIDVQVCNESFELLRHFFIQTTRRGQVKTSLTKKATRILTKRLGQKYDRVEKEIEQAHAYLTDPNNHMNMNKDILEAIIHSVEDAFNSLYMTLPDHYMEELLTNVMNNKQKVWLEVCQNLFTELDFVKMKIFNDQIVLGRMEVETGIEKETETETESATLIGTESLTESLTETLSETVTETKQNKKPGTGTEAQTEKESVTHRQKLTFNISS